MPQNIMPMKATLISAAFDNKDWLFEIKYDGYRIISFIDKGAVKLKTRKNIDYTAKFHVVADELRKMKINAVIDGEVVVLNKAGVSDFEALQGWRSDADGVLYYYVFDLLWLNGKDYMSQPVYKRKATLKDILPQSDRVRFCDHIEGHGMAAFNMAKENALEGVIAKKLESTYKPSVRSKEWLKIKAYQEGEFLIAGYTRNEGPGLVSSLLLAQRKDGQLHYAGDAGTGFSDREAKEILTNIKVVKKCPMIKEPVFRAGRWGRKAPSAVIWCKPELFCLVKYLEITKAGELRHASFLKLRT
jgi:bifunctional non-homologous end joining protein LigD